MENILYTTSANESRIREMVTSTGGNTDFSTRSLKKIILSTISFLSGEQTHLEITFPLNETNYTTVGNPVVTLEFQDAKFMFLGCPLMFKLDNIYKTYSLDEVSIHNYELKYSEFDSTTDDSVSEPETIMFITNIGSEESLPYFPSDPGAGNALF